MSKLKVIVTRAWPAEVEATLKEKYDVQLNETDVAMTKDEMKAALGNCDVFPPHSCALLRLTAMSLQYPLCSR